MTHVLCGMRFILRIILNSKLLRVIIKKKHIDGFNGGMS